MDTTTQANSNFYSTLHDNGQ